MRGLDPLAGISRVRCNASSVARFSGTRSSDSVAGFLETQARKRSIKHAAPPVLVSSARLREWAEGEGVAVTGNQQQNLSQRSSFQLVIGGICQFNYSLARFDCVKNNTVASMFSFFACLTSLKLPCPHVQNKTPQRSAATSKRASMLPRTRF